MILGRRASGYPGKGLAGRPGRNRRVRVDRELCSGCGDCLAACVYGIIRMDSRGRVSIGRSCRGCGRCADACPEGALTVHGR
ncbi:MAG: hypothetical protein AVO35_00610 [Candidatus Aegiribacteria sp. MLS_C]|nr:MAG: hypothetical protein AVO35_00610 [Candidatus Aegiribacteria sp. MLS_C]